MPGVVSKAKCARVLLQRAGSHVESLNAYMQDAVNVTFEEPALVGVSEELRNNQRVLWKMQGQLLAFSEYLTALEQGSGGK